MDQTKVVSLRPTMASEGPLAAVNAPSALVPAERLSPARFTQLIPAKVTKREKRLGKEIAYRLGVQRGHHLLHAYGVEAINQLHETTHRHLITGIVGMNTRVRAIADPDDQAEIALVTLEQKEMYKRHQFGILEAGAYRIAQEVDRPLYGERRGGLVGWLLDA